MHCYPFPLITTYPVLRVSPLCPCWCSKVDECIAHITPAAEVNRKVHEVIQALAQHWFCGILGTCGKCAGNVLGTCFRYSMKHCCCCCPTPCLIPFVKPIDQHFPRIAIGNVPQLPKKDWSCANMFQLFLVLVFTWGTSFRLSCCGCATSAWQWCSLHHKFFPKIQMWFSHDKSRTAKIRHTGQRWLNIDKRIVFRVHQTLKPSPNSKSW